MTAPYECTDPPLIRNRDLVVRKTKEDALRTRDAILDAAERVFQEKGVARTTVDDIARSANCTRGAVYWHFQNKIDLFTALMERTHVPLFDQFERLLQDDGNDPMGSLTRACISNLTDVETNPRTRAALDIMINRCELVDEMAAVKTQQFERHQCFIKYGTDVFRKAQTVGQIRADLDPALCALMLHAMVMGLIRQWLLSAETFSLSGTAETMVAVLFEGFGYSGAELSRRIDRHV
jgi:TetR/AcrR family acrAB operon transcriptional repressor